MVEVHGIVSAFTRIQSERLEQIPLEFTESVKPHPERNTLESNNASVNRKGKRFNRRAKYASPPPGAVLAAACRD